MNYEQWSAKYPGVILNEEQARGAIRDILEVFSARRVILYGAGKLGRQILELLTAIHVPVHAFIDRNAGSIRNLAGVPVWEPEALREIRNPEQFVLFATVNKLTVQSIRDDLTKATDKFKQLHVGFDFRVTLQSAICLLRHSRGERLALKDCYECSILDNTCPVLERHLRERSGFDPVSSTGTPNLKMIGYVLGNVCTLNCQHCCESIPLFPKTERSFVPTEVVIEDISKLARACEFVTLLEFVGGEPLLHPGLPSILTAALAIKNIGVIHVFTNGTVTPGPEIGALLANPRIVLYLSNYVKSLSDVHRSKVGRTEDALVRYGASFVHGADISWYDLTSFAKVCDDETALRAKFSKCFLHTCNRLHRGALYRCPHHYGGVMLGYLTPKDDIVRIHEFSDEVLSGELDRFIALPFADACRYCRMPFDAPFVRLGIQV